MDTSTSKRVIAPAPKRSWRRHSEEFKARVIELARQPNTSVAAVALANGLNANMLRRWVRENELAGEPTSAHPPAVQVDVPGFVQLAMPTPAAVSTEAMQPGATRVEVDIHRSGTHVRAKLPLDSQSAAWLREVMG